MRGHLERKHPGKLNSNFNSTSNSTTKTLNGINMEDYDDDEENMEYENNEEASPPDSALYDDAELEVNGRGLEHEEISRSLAYMCVLDLKPLSLIEGDGFKNFISYVDSSYVLASYNAPDSVKTVASCIDEMYDNELSKVYDELSDKYICVSCETWNKTNLDKYLLVTVHFVTYDCKFTSKLLCARLLPPNNTIIDETKARLNSKSNFLTTVKEGLKSFGVEKEQIMSLVINSDGFEHVETDDDTLVVPCLNRIVQLCFTNVQSACSEIFGYDIFDLCLKLAYKYIPDYETLSRNPFSLIVAIQENQSLLEQIPDNNIPWNYLSVLITLLGPVNDVIEITSDEDKVFLSTVFPLMYAIKDQLLESANILEGDETTKQIIETVTKVIMETLQNGYEVNLDSENYGTYAMCICCFLDPRYKALKFISDTQRQSIHDAILSLMTDIPSESSSTTSTTTPTTTTTSTSSPTNSSNNVPTPAGRQTRSHHKSDNNNTEKRSKTNIAGYLLRILGKRWEFVSSSQANSEIQKYIKHPVPNVTADPLRWWYSNKKLYPTLSSAAIKFLGISAIASRAPYMFTKLGIEIDQMRNALEPEYVDKILFLHRIVKASLCEVESTVAPIQFEKELSNNYDVKDEAYEEEED